MNVLRAIHISTVAMLLLWLLIAPLAWMMRDGVEPDTVTSRGMLAFARFLTTFYWGPVTLLLVIATWATRRRPGWD